MKLNTLFTIIAAVLGLLFTTTAAPSGKKGLVPAQLTLPDGCEAEIVRDAGGRAVKALLSEFIAQKDIAVKRFAVLPLMVDLDGGYFTDQVRDQFTTLGKPVGFELYTRMDDEWDNLLEEIAMGQRVGDTMDAATIQKFGRIQGVQGVISGKVVSVTRDGDDTRVRVSLRAFEVETGRQLWGKEASEIAHRDRTTIQKLSKFSESPHAKLYGWIALGVIVGLIVLFFIVKAFGSAARPR
jgi:hypothetical protein